MARFRSFNSQLRLLVGLILPWLAWGLPNPVFGQDADTTAPQPQIAEEIVVYGELGLGALRRELRLAEDQVNGLYNEINDDDRFDIVCRRKARTGTFISVRICEPVFLSELRYENHQDFIQGRDAELGDAQLRVLYRELYEEFQQRLEQAALSNQALFQAIKRHSEIKSAYTDKGGQ